MPLISLITASLIAVPQPNPAYLRIVVGAMPPGAMRGGQAGAAYVRTWLDPEGKVYRCEIVELFGDRLPDRIVCDPFMRARMVRAVAPDGTASYGMKTTLIKHLTEGPKSREIQAMTALADITLPAVAESDAAQDQEFLIAVQVQGNGSVSHCEGIEGASGELVERACQKARQGGQIAGTDRDGTPVSYVASLLVRLELSQG